METTMARVRAATSQGWCGRRLAKAWSAASMPVTGTKAKSTPKKMIWTTE
jgi:hypothetical protein